jgi:hypothetical protein
MNFTNVFLMVSNSLSNIQLLSPDEDWLALLHERLWAFLVIKIKGHITYNDIV